MKSSHAFTFKFVSLNLITAIIALAVVAASAPVARAATLTVINDNDNGTGSLRQAIADAAAGDTITFAGDYTILLASTLTIAKNLTIDGAGHSVTVSGNNAVRVFIVNSGVTFNLNAITVTKGKTPAGSSCPTPCGGGLLNNGGTVNVTNSTFSGNSAAYVGGGISNFFGTVTVTNSTFSGNSADYGGGINNASGTVTVTNSTFSGNSALGGVVGGIRNATVKNTIIANSTGGNCGGVSGGSNNLADDATCGASFTNSASILLGTLGNYGGPTQTFPLLPGSSAIDAGNPATCANTPVNHLDQRGQARDDWQCDIGAYELRLSDSATVVKTITGPGVYTFGPTRVKLEIAAGYTGTLSSVTVTRTVDNHPGRTGASGDHGVGWGEYWTLTPNSGAASFAVSLTLPTLFTPDANSKVCRFIGGAMWNCAAGISSTVPFTTITRAGVTAFSDWAVGDEAGPNAVTLSRLSAASQTSEVSKTSEVWLLVALLVIGGGWLTRRRRAQTSEV